MLRTGQCRHGWTQEKKQPGMRPQNPRTKRATTAGKSGPTAGKKSIANCRQTTNNHHSYRGSRQTQITQQDGRDARQSSTETMTVQTVLKDRKLSSHSSSRKPSRSLSQRRGRLDSEDRGDSSPLQCNDEKVERWSSVFRRLRRCCRLNPLGNGLTTLRSCGQVPAIQVQQ